ncbi:hypothetical protein [Leptospira sarikeiensis]|uniref:Uncharacterized protein n=1 Tax=Leptospira sarikeiensis TaxID=2484943 RepID=A0A4R9K1M7_9LEPT|nr:hypothetical protein [Leptospira sarikeiensis]TGL58720.1 hypothetical protein EHQ64_16850 [Leptospira sarikeiensis]
MNNVTLRCLVSSLIILGISQCKTNAEVNNVDHLWEESNKLISEICCARKINIDELLDRKHEKTKTRINGTYIYDKKSQKYIFDFGDINGAKVSPDNKEIQRQLLVLNSASSKGIYTEVIKTDRRKTIGGKVTIGFDYKREIQSAGENSYFKSSYGTKWIDPISKLCLSNEEHYTLPTFSLYRIIFEKSELNANFEYDRNGKLVFISNDIIMKLKFSFFDSTIQTKIKYYL